MRKYSLLLSIVGLLGTTLGFAAGNGSIYSRYGVGELTSFMSGRSLGMGGTGLAILSEGTINRTNPAALTRLGYVRFEADFQYNGYGMNDGTSTSYLSSGNFQGLMLALPIYKKYGIVTALGILPFSTVSYNVVGTETNNAISATQSAEGSGGLTNAQISLSGMPMDDLSLGITLHYLFGAIHNKQSIAFASSDYFTSESDQTNSASGIAYTLGAVFTGIDNALSLSSTKKLNAALTIFTGSSMSLTQSTVQNYTTVLDSTVDTKSGTLTLPVKVAYGLAYMLRDRTQLALDAEYGNWADYKFLGLHPAEIRSNLRVGVGVDFLSSRTLTDSYWDQVSYRFGAFMQSSYLKVNDQPINEYFATTGFSFPFSTAGGESRINVAIEYGVRGTTSFKLQRDSILRMTFSFTANELTWFVPPEID